MIKEIQSDSGNTYTIDTEELTCTCPQWKFRCKHFSKDHERRLCKHLIAYFDAHPEHKPASLARVDKILDAIESNRTHQLRSMFDPFVAEIDSALRSFKGVIDKFEVCGSYRRKCSKVSDLNYIICLSPNQSYETVNDYLTNILGYTLTHSSDTKYLYSIYGMIEVNIRLIPSEQWVFALLHYTGDKEENLSMRAQADKIGYILDETGIRYKATNRPLETPIETEEDVYKLLNLPYKYPWLRTH